MGKWKRTCYYCGKHIKKQGRKVMRDRETGKIVWAHKKCYYGNK